MGMDAHIGVVIEGGCIYTRIRIYIYYIFYLYTPFFVIRSPYVRRAVDPYKPSWMTLE